MNVSISMTNDAVPRPGQDPRPAVAHIDRSFQNDGTFIIPLTLHVRKLEQSGLLSLEDALQAGRDLALREPGSNVYGVRQALQGTFEVLALDEQLSLGGTAVPKVVQPHSDDFQSKGPGTDHRHNWNETVIRADADLKALVGGRAWRDVHTNQLNWF